MSLRETLRNKVRREQWYVTNHNIVYMVEQGMIEGEPILMHSTDIIGSYIMADERYYEFNIMDMFWDYIPFEGTFLDIGANIGNHTLMFNRLRPNVTIHSFEPVYRNYILLHENTKNKSNVTTYSIGLGNKFETAKVIQPHSNNHGGVKVDNENGNETIVIIPGDELKLNNVSFIKMDVEGYELNALQGLRDTINKYNPKIWIEDFTGEAIEWLKTEHGYEVVMDDGGYGNYMMIKK